MKKKTPESFSDRLIGMRREINTVRTRFIANTHPSFLGLSRVECMEPSTALDVNKPVFWLWFDRSAAIVGDCEVIQGMPGCFQGVVKNSIKLSELELLPAGSKVVFSESFDII